MSSPRILRNERGVLKIHETYHFIITVADGRAFSDALLRRRAHSAENLFFVGAESCSGKHSAEGGTFSGGACVGICIAGSGGPVHGCFFRGRRCGRGPEQLFVFSVSHPLPGDVSAAEGIRHRVFRLGAALPFAFLSALLPGARRSAGAGAFRIQQEESYPSDFLLRRRGQYHGLLVLGISELS